MKVEILFSWPWPRMWDILEDEPHDFATVVAAYLQADVLLCLLAKTEGK